RPATRQVSGGAIAEPAGGRVHVDTLSDGELGARAMNVVAELARAGAHASRVGDRPAVIEQPLEVFRVPGMDVQGDLEAGSGDPLGQLDQAAELMVLQAHRLTADLQLAVGTAPGGDGGEAGRPRSRRLPRPTLQDPRREGRGPGSSRNAE